MSQAGIVDITGTHPEIPTLFVANVGTAVPIANTIELLGAAVAAHGVPLQTVASGNTVDFNIQYTSAAGSSVAANAGVASFNSSFFTVDANGFVSLSGVALVESFMVDAATSPGTNPVTANGSGIVTITGGQVAAGTTAHVIQTNSLAANTYTVQVQRSQAVSSSTIGDNGVSHFNSTYFTVDGNGFVSINGAAIGETITGNTGGALSPTAGNWNILGTSTAAGTTPVQTAGSGSTLTVQVQTTQAIASTNATNIGLAAFNSSQFSVDSNGFVSLNSSGSLQTLSDDTNTTITPSAGNIQLVGHVNEQGSTKFSTVVAGTHLANINPMSSARWIVDPLGFNGTHTTISSAISSATSGDTIFLLPGTYTENPTLKAGVNLAAYDCDGFTPNVTILGKCTFTGAGTVSISGICLETNNDYFLSITGSSASVVNLFACNLQSTNNTGILNSSSSSNAVIFCYSCFGDITTTGISFITITGAGGINIDRTKILNSGASTTNSTVTSSGTINLHHSEVYFPITIGGTGGATIDNSLVFAPNTTAITSSTSNSISVYNSFVSGGSGSAISIGTGSACSLSECVISSSNTHAITGLGTLNLGEVTFSGSSSNINTSTVVALPVTIASLTLVTPLSPASGGTGVSNPSAHTVAVAEGSSAYNFIGPGTSGQLLQSGGASGDPAYTTATYPSTAGTAGNVLTSDGTNWNSSTPAASGFSTINVQVFTTSGTYTPTTNMKYCTIEVVGGGGAGGGAASTSSTQGAAGGGGGGGGYARKTVAAATIGASKSVTIGAGGIVGSAGNNPGNAGGTTSVGSTIVSATGGNGGNGSAVSGATNIAFAAGGTGGVGSSGDFNATGNAGTGGYASGVTPTGALPGAGGGSYLGGGAAPVGAGTNSTSIGNAGQNYGGGGSGGYNLLSEASGTTGSAGAQGIVIITEYIG